MTCPPPPPPPPAQFAHRGSVPNVRPYSSEANLTPANLFPRWLGQLHGGGSRYAHLEVWEWGGGDGGQGGGDGGRRHIAGIASALFSSLVPLSCFSQISNFG